MPIQSVSMPETADTPGGWGRNIAARRAELGLTQRQVGDMVGRTANSVARWERGEVDPGWDVQPAIAQALDTTVTDLFPRDDAEVELVTLVARLGSGCS